MRLLKYLTNLFHSGAYAVMDPKDNSVTFSDKLAQMVGPDAVGCGVALVSTEKRHKNKLCFAIDKNIIDDVQTVVGTDSGKAAGFVLDNYVAGLLVTLGFPWDEEQAQLVYVRKYTSKGLKRPYYTIEKP